MSLSHVVSLSMNFYTSHNIHLCVIVLLLLLRRNFKAMEPERVAICQKPIFSQYFSFRVKSYEEGKAARTINTGRDRYFNGKGGWEAREKGRKRKRESKDASRMVAQLSKMWQ